MSTVRREYLASCAAAWRLPLGVAATYRRGRVEPRPQRRVVSGAREQLLKDRIRALAAIKRASQLTSRTGGQSGERDCAAQLGSRAQPPGRLSSWSVHACVHYLLRLDGDGCEREQEQRGGRCGCEERRAVAAAGRTAHCSFRRI